MADSFYPIPSQSPQPGALVSRIIVPVTPDPVAEAITTFAAQPHNGDIVNEAYSAEEEAHFGLDLHTTALDSVPPVVAGPPAAPAAQPYDETGRPWFVVSNINVSDVGARAPPGLVDEVGRRVFLTSPEAAPAGITDAELQAAGQLAVQPWFEAQDIDTELQNDTTLDAASAFARASATGRFAATVLALGPEAYWRLGESSGPTAFDSAHSHDGTWSGSPAGFSTKGLAAPDADTAVTFDGVDDFATVPNDSALRFDGAEPWSLMAIVNVPVGNSQIAPIIAGEFNGSTVQFELGFYDGTGAVQRPSVGFYDGVAWRVAIHASETMTLGVDHILVGTWDGTTLRIYQDGVEKANNVPGASPISSTARFFLGARWDNAASPNKFVGVGDELAVFPSTLAPTDVYTLYSVAFEIPERIAQMSVLPAPEIEAEDYDWSQQHASTLDVSAFLAGPPAAADDSYIAAQDLPDQQDWSEPDWEYGPLIDEQEELIAGPPDADHITQAAQPHYGELPIPEDATEDYANDATVDTSWAMDFASGDEVTSATEPLAEQPWFADQDIDTELANDAALDVAPLTVAPDAFDLTIATQYPLAEHPWFPTEDIDAEADNDSTIEVTAAFFPPAGADDGYIAALDLPDQTDLSEPEWMPAEYHEQNEGAFSPNDAFDLTIATQPLAEQPWFEAQDIDTELQNDSTLDITGAFCQPDVTDEFQAAQYPLPEQPWYPDPDTEDYDDSSTLDVTPALAPPLFIADAEGAAATQVFEQDIASLYPDPDPTNDQPLVDGAVEALQSPNDSFDTTIATQPLPGDDTWTLIGEDPFIPDANVEQNEFLSVTADDGYIASLDVFPQPFDEEPEDPTQVFIEHATLAYLLGDDGVYAAQDLFPQPLDEDPEQPDVFIEHATVVFLAGDDGYIAALDLPDQWADALDETPEQPDTPLDTEWAQALALTDAIIAAVHHLAVEVDAHFIPEPEIAPNLSTTEVVAQLVPPPPPSGTGPDVFTAILRPRWHASTTLRWAASSKTRWRTSRIRARWLARLRSRIG